MAYQYKHDTLADTLDILSRSKLIFFLKVEMNILAALSAPVPLPQATIHLIPYRLRIFLLENMIWQDHSFKYGP